MKRLFGAMLAMATLVTVVPVQARETALVDNQKLSFEGQQTRGQVRGFILAGAQLANLGHAVEEDIDGALRITFNKEGKHYFTVGFAYDGRGLEIRYLDSKNLNFRDTGDRRYIHPSYSAWIDSIIKEIRRAELMGLNAKAEPTDPSKAAHLTLTSSGIRDVVSYAKLDDGNSCGRFEHIAAIRFRTEADTREMEKKRQEYVESRTAWGLKATLFPLTPITANLYVPAGRALRIQGQSGAVEVSGTTTTTRSCGPLFAKFSPQGGKKYQIDFAVTFQSRRGECSMRVIDATDPANPKPVPIESNDECNS